QIPAALIDQRLVGFARQTLPKGVFTGVADTNAIDPTPIRDRNDEYTIRLDDNATGKNGFWFRYSENRQTTNQSAGRPGITLSQGRPFTNYGVNYVHTFNPNLVVQTQFGHSFGSYNIGAFFTSGSEDLIRDTGFADSFARNFIRGGSLTPSL